MFTLKTRLDAINEITDTRGKLSATAIAQNHVGHIVSNGQMRAVAVPKFSTAQERQEQLLSDVPKALRGNWLVVVNTSKDAHQTVTVAPATPFVQNERREDWETGFKFPVLGAK